MSRTPSAQPGPAVVALRPGSSLIGAVVVVVALVLAACGSSDKISGTVVKDAQGCITEIPRRDTPPTISPVTSAVTKVGTKDEIKGKGCPPSATGFLSLDLIGATAKDAKVFTSSWQSKHPVTAQLGKNALLPGLETGLADLKVGGRRTITVPAKQAYGVAGNPSQGIGPDQDLVFVVDLISLTPKQRYCAAPMDVPKEVDGKPIVGKPDIDNPIEVPVGDVTVRDIKKGDGAAIGKSSYATVNYVGITCSTGKQFDSSFDRGEPITAALGSAKPTAEIPSVIPGWTDGLKGAKAGGIRQLAIPPQLAYGAQAQGDIQANESLTFVIEILSVSDKAPKVPKATTTTTTAPGATPGPTTTAPAG